MNHAPLSPTWQPISEVLVSNREPNRTELETIQHVRELALAFDHNEIPIEEVRRLSSGRERWTATRFTPPSHSVYRPMMAMLDALIRTDVGDRNGLLYGTKYGVFTTAELRESEARIEKTRDGLIRIRFPILRGNNRSPHYAENAEERRDIANTRTSSAPPKQRTVFE